MPQFTSNLSSDGAVVSALIGCSAARVAALQRGSQPVPPSIAVNAQIDTGASGTCIDPKVFKKLGLSPTGKVQVRTLSTGSSVYDTYQYDVSVIIHAGSGLVPLKVANIPVMASDFTGQAIDAVIGRDILSGCILIYNGGNGTFTLAY